MSFPSESLPGGDFETIVALASAPGRAAVTLVRLSGGEALAVLEGLTGRRRESFQSRRATLCRLSAAGRALDEALVTVFRAPHSYTGEDVVELSCHGSPWIVRELIAACVSLGARIARPGEFTCRAFLNGRLDLVQAEAVNDLIRSETAYQAEAARRQLEGHLSGYLFPIRRRLVDVLSHLETALEFVEEDVSPQDRAALAESLRRCREELAALAGSWQTGRVLRDGARVVLAGRPNVGKSSLFNRLVRAERALVTPHPGTTRDALREYLDVEGVPVWLMDTAGLRGGVLDEVERLGVERSRAAVQEADAVLLVCDGSQAWCAADEEAWRGVGAVPCVLVVNKSDLPRCLEPPPEVAGGARALVEVSALTGDGVEELGRVIAGQVGPGQELRTQAGVITNARHRACLERAVAALEAAACRLEEGWSEEFAAYDVRRALDALGELTGAVSTDELLDRIFSEFCIGK